LVTVVHLLDQRGGSRSIDVSAASEESCKQIPELRTLSPAQFGTLEMTGCGYNPRLGSRMLVLSVFALLDIE